MPRYKEAKELAEVLKDLVFHKQKNKHKNKETGRFTNALCSGPSDHDIWANHRGSLRTKALTESTVQT